MDIVFQAQETRAYENWLESSSGQRYLRNSLALLDHILDWRQGWRVLDVGCGLGSHLSLLKERGLLLSGLEAGPVAARLAAQRLGDQAEIQVGDAHELPYEDNSFDAVIMVNTLELVDRRALVLGEAARVAASRVCVITLNSLSWGGLYWRRPGAIHPLHQGRPLGLWGLSRLVREVLGPVPQRWAGVGPLTGGWVGRWPLANLMGVCAAVTPRFATRPLVAEMQSQPAKARPVLSHGRVSNLQRVK